MPREAADNAALLGLIGAGWLTIAVAERVRPFRPDWNRSRGDVGTDLVSLVVAGALAPTVGAVVAGPLRRRLGPHTAAPVVGRLPRPAQLGAAVLAYDLFHGSHHRLAHETALWRIHSVHHRPSRLYWFNATRFHPLELLGDIVGEQVILALLGLDADARLSLQVLRGVYGQIQHANVDLDSGALNAVLSTPERHRWHHSTDPAEGNANYGAVVAVWDRLLGTAYLPPGRSFDAVVGVGGD